MNRSFDFDEKNEASSPSSIPHSRMSDSNRRYQFGPYLLDEPERLLLREGEPVQITPKVFDMLLAFAENSGRVLSKDELMKLVWPGTFVQEANLAVNISSLRKMLGEQADGRQYIETIPRRGYRFAAQVTREPADGIISATEKQSGLIQPNDAQAITAVPVASSAMSLGERSASAARHTPETKYAKSGGVNIAYQVVGDGPLDLVFVMGWVSHLEYFWAEPSFARFLMRLASFSRLILFDKRGTGLSDPVPLNELPTLEQRMDDVRAVMDAVGSHRAALAGVSEGGPMCSLFAATYPEKTAALVMIGTYAKRIWEPDYPWAPTREQRERFCEEIQEHWGGPIGLEERAPSKASDPAFKQWWATYLRMGASPGAASVLTQMNAEIDVRNVLPSVRVPTLVIHRRDDRCLKIEEGRYVASLIPGAKLVELPGEDHLPFVGDQDAILDEIEEFLTGESQHLGHDRVLATVMLARIGKPDGASQLPADQVDRFHTQVRKEIELFRGREGGAVGDHIMATFDGPARAIKCACVISDIGRRLGIETSIGLHTGECDLLGNEIRGVAVGIGAEVALRAAPSEVLVSRTVKDLVAGSGFTFKDRGNYLLSEAFGEWQLFTIER